MWDVRDRKVVPYPGNLDEYLQHLEARLRPARAVKTRKRRARRRRLPEKDRKRLEAEARQAAARKLGPLKKEIAKLEARISELEAAQKEREAQLVDPAFMADYAKSRPVLDAHSQAAAELEKAMARWEAASSELASLGS